MADARTVAVLGTGLMGGPMAANLLAAGLAVRAWNRSAEKLAPLVAAGATACATPMEASAGADILVTMLADGPSTRDAVGGVLRPGLLWLQMGTVGPEWGDQLAQLAVEAGARYVDAPVVGSVAPARSGDLVILGSGDDADVDAAAPVFDAVGAKTMRLGAAGAGQRLKTVFNFWILAQTALGAEVLALAERLDISGKAFLEAIAGTIGDSAYLQTKGEAMVAGDYEPPKFRLRLSRKDVALAVASGAALGLDLRLGQAAVEAMDAAITAGFGDADFGAVIEATGLRRSGS